MTTMLPKRSFAVLAATAGLTMAACSQPADPESPDAGATVVDVAVGRTFELHAGETALLQRLGLRLAFRGVTEDSRCPTDVTCVWAGDATLHIRAAVGRADFTPFDVHTNVDPRSMRIGDHSITVVGLDPAPVSGRSIPNERYVVTLRIDR